MVVVLPNTLIGIVQVIALTACTAYFIYSFKVKRKQSKALNLLNKTVIKMGNEVNTEKLAAEIMNELKKRGSRLGN